MSRRRTVGLPWEWEPWSDPSLIRSDGPQRIYDQDAADPTYEPPRLRGFGTVVWSSRSTGEVLATATLGPAIVRAAEDLGLWAITMPLLWDGDQA